MKKKIIGILICKLLVLCTFSIGLMPTVVQASVTNYEITYVAQTGLNQITVSVKAQFCTACNPNYLRMEGDPAFPTYTQWIEGRYVAVRIKDANTGTILCNPQKLVCNQINWPLMDNNPRVIVVNDVMLTGVSTVIVESDIYCSWCGHWYPTPKSMTVLPITICIDPGHSPTDTNPDKQKEYAINKGIADKLKCKLEAYGVNVYFTNPDHDITERINYVNTLKPTSFISLHCNATEGFDSSGIPIGTVAGREVWFYKDTDSNKQAVNELDLAVRTLNGLTKEAGKIFFYPTGKRPNYLPPTSYGYDGACYYYNYAGWLARDKDYASDLYHLGQDIPASQGNSVYAIANGTVVYISSNGWNKNPGDNNLGIVIKHKLNDGSEFLALYGHVHSNVILYQNVKAGVAFATIGPYGNVPHLHFGIHPGLTMPNSNWGFMPTSSWIDPNAHPGQTNGPDTNGFVDPINWIISNLPAPNEARKPIPKDKQNPWSTGIPILKGITVCPAILHEMEFFDFFGSLSYKYVTYQNMLELMNSNVWREDAAQGIYNEIIGYIEERGATINGKCPIDINVTDPDSLRINKQINEISGATYNEIDLDDDGDLDDQIRIPDRKIGDYFIEVIPEPDAQPTDTYNLEICLFGITYFLAENVQISNIPSEPYLIESTENGIILPEIDDEPPSIIIEVPSPWEALQDGVTLSSIVSDSSGVDWVKYTIREPGGPQGTIIDSPYESLTASSTSDDKWELLFDTTQLDDGYYVLFANASDNLGNIGYTTVNFSIRNWAVLENLPNTPNSKAGRTMPIKFSLRVVEAVDPTEPFVRNEELTIKIYVKTNPGTILQTSTYGSASADYRISSTEEQYITKFHTLNTPKTYVVQIWRDILLIGSFEFSTVK